MLAHSRSQILFHRSRFIEDGEELPWKPTDELGQEQNTQHLDHLWTKEQFTFRIQIIK